MINHGRAEASPYAGWLVGGKNMTNQPMGVGTTFTASVIDHMPTQMTNQSA